MLQYAADFVPVRRVTSPEERDAVCRLRYRVYVEELNKTGLKDADHTRRQIRSDRDEHPDSINLYIGPAGAPTGTLRLDLYPNGLPAPLRALYGTDSLPPIDGLPTAIVTRMVIERGHRGRLGGLSLARAGYRLGTLVHGTRVGFTYASPGLMPLYRRLGYRSYGGLLMQTPDGLRIPLISLPTDLPAYQDVRSPLTDLCRRARRNLQTRDTVEALIAHVQHQEAACSVEPDQVWRALRRAHHQTPIALLDGLSVRNVRHLCRSGVLLRVQPGQMVLREGLLDRELFIALDGRFSVWRGSQQLATLGAGATFGELALLNPSGRRTASVQSDSSGTLLMLRRNTFRELLRERPQLGGQLMMNLSRVMATRFTPTPEPQP